MVSNTKYNINCMLRIWHFTLVLNSISFGDSENIYEHSNPINKEFVHIYKVRTKQRFVFKVFKTKDYITNLEVFHCIKKYEVKLGKCCQLLTTEIHLNTKPLFLIQCWNIYFNCFSSFLGAVKHRYPYLLSYIFHN